MRRRKFIMYDRDENKYKIIPTNNIVAAIHHAWNYEFEVFERDTELPLFSPQDSNECNSDLLKEYGLQVIDYKESRVLQSITTKEIYKAPWDKM